ncbi:MAG: DUF3352 domain-containing protein [Anaerolineae bacterium]|nr:DUF3352 domain-containing protein [Anaerolineae bacterium]
MFKRFLSVLLLLVVVPVAAQESLPSAADFIPANFAGFIRLNTQDAQNTLLGMNESTFAAAILQPTRVAPSAERVYYDYIPFASLFDIEGTTFVNNIFPWLGDDLVVAYRSFDAALSAQPQDTLIIIASTNLLSALNALTPIINEQDLPSREEYRGITIYIGDKTAIAVTAPAVFIGPLELVRAGLDVQAGVTEPLIAQPAYQAITAASPTDAFLSAYVTGDYLLPALNGLLSGRAQSVEIYRALGEALATQFNATNFEKLLLDGGFDGAGISLVRDRLGRHLNASAFFHSRDAASPLQLTEFDSSLLEMIPRNALLVHSGTDFNAFVEDALTILPLSNFAAEMFTGLPIRTAGTLSESVGLPTAANLQAALESLKIVLEAGADLDLQQDVIEHLSGGYTVALLPRPNNPVPLLNIPFDLMLVGEVDDGAATTASLIKLLQTVFNITADEAQTSSDWTLTTLSNDGRPVFTIAHDQEHLLITTGDAARLALDAERGDNRLINLPAWQQFEDMTQPALYVDAYMFYNTFFPSELLGGGFVVGENNRERIVMQVHPPVNDLHQIALTVTLP